MISKNQIKRIRSLELKKNREKEGLFVAEGPKVVGDLMAKTQPQMIAATAEWYASKGMIPRNQDVTVTEDELRKISFLQHPQQVLALFAIPHCEVKADICEKELCIALDKVQDPGNLGTIIRVADWFGISTIFCSNDTADAFNPKVVQATMGSIARVNIIYTDLRSMMETMPDSTPIYATSLNGHSIYNQELTSYGLIVMGNEGNGISDEVMAKASRSLFIPCYRHTPRIDSLNVAIATAVICAEFRRRE